MSDDGTWVEISCPEREELIDRLGRSYNGFSAESGIGVLSSKTDLDGEYGRAEVFTEWGYRETDVPVLRDIRWPKDDAPCEHYAFAPAVSVPVADTTEPEPYSLMTDCVQCGCAVDATPPIEGRTFLCDGCFNRDDDEPASVPAAPVPDDMLAQIAARVEAALDEVSALCHGKRWTMQIPARPDKDSDLVITGGLADVNYLLSELAAAHWDRDEARAELDSCRTAQAKALVRYSQDEMFKRLLTAEDERDNAEARAGAYQVDRGRYRKYLIERTAERDAALAQLAKVRELAEDGTAAQSFSLRQCWAEFVAINVAAGAPDPRCGATDGVHVCTQIAGHYSPDDLHDNGSMSWPVDLAAAGGNPGDTP